MTTTTAPFSPANPTAVLLGEIVTWEITGLLATKTTVRDALTKAGLDPELCRELNNRSAFIRGLRQLTDERIVRKVGEDATTLQFQFTREAKLPGRLDYLYEAVMTFDKATAAISCPDKPELENAAREQLTRAFEARRSNDVTNLVQKIFKQHGDLFAIRNQGGAYFVPEQHGSLVEKVDTFVNLLGGNFRRFPIPAGYPTGAKAVQESVAEALAGSLAEYASAIDGFDMAETSMRRIETMAQRVQCTRIKIEGYAHYLADKAADLLQEADAVKSRLLRKVSGFGDEPATVETKRGEISVNDLMSKPAPAA